MKIIESKDDEIFDIELEESLLRKNEELAELNGKILDEHNILAIDVLGAIGSGKTSLIQRMVKILAGKRNVAAIAGDLTTTIDADRIRGAGAQVIQVNTGRECHLDANLVKKAITELSLEDIDILFIENVGNLICPGEFPLGAHKRVVVVSVTEGPHMVVKHPYILMDAALLAINKIDLANAMGVSLAQLERDALRIKPSLKVVKTNAISGEGVTQMIEELEI